MNKHEQVLGRVLSNLSKAVLKIKCRFSFLAPGDDAVGYTYCKKGLGAKSETTAEICINRSHKMFDKLDETMKNVAAFGVAVHEMLHQKFTDFVAFERSLKRLSYGMENLFKTIFNIFEDSRIEFYANQVFGGKALSALKYVINLTWDDSPNIDKNAHPLYQVMNALIQYGDTGRIKGEFSDEDTRQVFLHCCEFFDKAIVSTSCTECLRLSQECTEFLYQKYAQALNHAMRNDIQFGSGGRGEDAKEQKSGSKTANAKQQNRKATRQQENSKSQQSQQNAQSGQNEQNSQNGSDSNGSSSKSNSNKKGKEEQNNGDKKGKGSGKENSEEDGSGSKNGTNSEEEEEGDESSGGNNSQNGEDEGENGNNGNEQGDEGEDENGQNESSESQSAPTGSMSGSSQNSGSNNKNSEVTGSDGNDNDNSDEEGQEATFDEFVFDEDDIEDFAEELVGKMEAAEKAIEQEIKTSEGDTYTFLLEDAECNSCFFQEIPCTEDTFCAYQEFATQCDINGLSDELAKDMEVILKTRPTGWERNKSGKLNIKRWMDPNFNSPYIFDKRLSNESSIAVTILIDESGSMCGKINHVRIMASTLAEAFSKLGIKFNILGHTGGEKGDRVNTIREYSDFDSDVFEQVILINDHSYNYDGASIKIAADKLAKREERNKLMFVLTDGASHNVANTELAIRDANKIGTVVGVALCCGSSAPMIEKMYGDKFITVESMNDLMERIVDKLKEVSALWS